MSRPVVGIIGNPHLINSEYLVHGAGEMNAWAVREVCDALPVIIPPDAMLAPVVDLMEACDGFVFTGGRPNVHPKEYGEALTNGHGDTDEARDALALPLIRALVERGQPYLAICRGFQEMNVAMGGSLYPEIRDLPGRDNHRMPPDGTLAEKFALRKESGRRCPVQADRFPANGKRMIPRTCFRGQSCRGSGKTMQPRSKEEASE